MTRSDIHVFVEPAYTSSSLYQKSLMGIRKRAAKHSLSLCVSHGGEADVPQSLAKAAVIVSTSIGWTKALVGKLRNSGVKSIVVGTFSDEYGKDVSGTSLDREKLVTEAMEYLIYAGRKRIASIGNEIHDTNDMTRQRAFLSAARSLGLPVSERDVFTVDSCIDACVHEFLQNAARYDAVICVNDIVAVYLMSCAMKQGIRIPEDLFVIGSGDYSIGRLITPGLTTTTLDYFQLGFLAVEIWELLNNNPAIGRVMLTVPCRMISRGSTACIQISQDSQAHAFSESYQVPEQKGQIVYFQRFEKLLLQADALDFSILDRLVRNMGIEEIAETLFVSPGTVKYRLKKMYTLMHFQGKSKFAAWLREFFPNMPSAPLPPD